MNHKLTSIALGVMVGSIIFYIASIILGYTVAIPIPIALLSSIKSRFVHWSLLFLWDTLVVQLLGAGILVAIASYFFVKKSIVLWSYFAISFIVAELFFSLSSVSSWFTAPILLLNVCFLYLPHFVIVVVCALYFSYVGHKHKKI